MVEPFGSSFQYLYVILYVKIDIRYTGATKVKTNLRSSEDTHIPERDVRRIGGLFD